MPLFIGEWVKVRIEIALCYCILIQVTFDRLCFFLGTVPSILCALTFVLVTMLAHRLGAWAGIPEAQRWSAQHRGWRCAHRHALYTPTHAWKGGGHGWATAVRLKGANMTLHFLNRLHLPAAKMPHCAYTHLCPVPCRAQQQHWHVIMLGQCINTDYSAHNPHTRSLNMPGN